MANSDKIFVFQKCLHTDSILKQRHDILKPNYHNDIQVPTKAPQLHHTGHHSQARFQLKHHSYINDKTFTSPLGGHHSQSRFQLKHHSYIIQATTARLFQLKKAPQLHHTGHHSLAFPAKVPQIHHTGHHSHSYINKKPSPYH